MAKTTFRTHWGWSRISEWGGGVRLPDAIRLPDGQVVDLSWEEYEGATYRHFNSHPRSKAKYMPMLANGTVRLFRDAGGSGGYCYSGERWARMDVIAPKGSTFLYGGLCPDCGEETVDYSEDPDSPAACPKCLAVYEEQKRLIEGHCREIEAEERLADEAWHREYGHLLEG